MHVCALLIADHSAVMSVALQVNGLYWRPMKTSGAHKTGGKKRKQTAKEKCDIRNMDKNRLNHLLHSKQLAVPYLSRGDNLKSKCLIVPS